MAVWVGAAFWGSMALDWCFELPRPLRVAVLAGAGIGLAVVLFRFILRRAFVRLSDGNMATLLERQFPQFNDSLLTSVLLCGGEQAGYSLRGSGSGEQGARNDPASTELSPGSQLPAPRFEMLARTTRVAQQGLAAAPLSQVFNPMPLVRKAVIALGLAAAVGLLAVVNSPVLNLWAERNLLLSGAIWPRKIRLEAVGFADDGSGHLVAKVAKGSNFDLRVQAFRGDTEIPVIPQKVEVRYRDDAGGRDRKTMKNIGRPASSPGTIYPWSADAVLQEYSHQFTGVLSTQHLDIAGGDARLRDLELKVVPNPDLTLKLVCKYPHYIERNPLTIDPVSPAVPIRVPIGSIVTIFGTSTKPLETARIDGPAEENNQGWSRQFGGDELGAERKEFTYSFEPFPAPKAKPADAAAGSGGKGAEGKNAGQKTAQGDPADKSPHDYLLQFTLRDTDGLKTRDPLVLTLVAVPDEAPEVKVHLVGTREPVVTPKGRLPVAGTITDDWGLGKVWWNYTVSERARRRPREAPLPMIPSREKLPRPPGSARARCRWPSCLNICQSMSSKKQT